MDGFSAWKTGLGKKSKAAGRLKNDYRNADLRDTAGRKADYDTDSFYHSVHLGVG
jgi:hypothetical protein